MNSKRQSLSPKKKNQHDELGLTGTSPFPGGFLSMPSHESSGKHNKQQTPFASLLAMPVLNLLIIALFFLPICNSMKESSCSSYCGNLSIQYPFRLRTDPANCGHFLYELACEHERTVLKIDHGRFYVESISYDDETLQAVDPGLKKNDCSSLPRYSWTQDNMSYVNVYRDNDYSHKCEFSEYLDASPCITNSSVPQAHHLYVFLGNLPAASLSYSCDYFMMTPAVIQTIGNLTYADIHKQLTKGYELSWSQFFCLICAFNGGYCLYSFNLGEYKSDKRICRRGPLAGVNFSGVGRYLWSKIKGKPPKLSTIQGYFTVARTTVGILCMSVFLIYKWRKSASIDEYVEEFLRNYENLKLRKFSYSDIKKMTGGFKEQLGQGGFGSVFKGKISDGCLVAVKMLTKAKGDGRDFMNEVATIGIVRHVNVVQLLGFCFEGSKKALIYEYMPNGSLDKYLFSQEDVCALSWSRMYEIALAIAHGIEYLHRGCPVRILHLDIKPHNILLNEDFTPKISDFGLAKLYPRHDSVVSLTNARGTMGYMAPELLYKNIGGISTKSDVYSFGMLLMEMAGRRKNLDPFVENLSQIYFPSWIYDQLEQKGEVEIKDATAEGKDIGNRMIIIALWCIQLKPADRPSMTKVVEMLEDTSEPLQLPPKPALAPDRKRS
ncbi:Receptor serine/threonine kinase [Theobroma cacao]|uniref:Receptor serine/threonine kinase n=1 Tax=Theobroma cacao TaxID=3641 RepID=A0A061DUP2_THECC|nr:Receptor serine/threonine kinase [Theobroma cacao]